MSVGPSLSRGSSSIQTFIDVLISKPTWTGHSVHSTMLCRRNSRLGSLTSLDRRWIQIG